MNHIFFTPLSQHILLFYFMHQPPQFIPAFPPQESRFFYFAGANRDLSCPSGLGVISPAFVNAIFVNIGPTSS